MSCGCGPDGVCTKCKGGKLAVIGVLVLLNTQFNVISWPMFIGALLVLGGIAKIAMPNGCGHCSCDVAAAKPAKRKK